MEIKLPFIRDSFWQLLTVYVLLILAIAFSYISKFSYYFNAFALIIAIFGISLLTKNKNINSEFFNEKIHIALFILAIILIIFLRVIPYQNGISIPLGYDAGLYNYIIEHGLENMDYWVRAGVEPGFLYFMTFLNSFISSNYLLTYVFIGFIVLLGISIYIFTKEYFQNKDIALLAILFYSVSLVQFKVFTFLYYKNIIALSLLLLAFTFLNQKKYWLFTIFGILIGIIHRPTFYIFGLSYLAFALTSPYSNKKYSTKILFKHILHGSLILLGTLVFYIGKFKPSIINLISPVVSSFIETGTAPGTFITFLDYQFSILFYLPLAILGLFALIQSQKEKLDYFFFYTIFLLAIVYFQFFFFNRYIIFLDIALIILSALGSYKIIQEKNLYGVILVAILLVSGLILAFNVSLNTKSLISQGVFDSISKINVDENAYIISISSKYSPYLQGYAGENLNKNYRIIAPGLLDYDLFATKERWNVFWQDLDASELKSYYNEEIYLFTPNQIDNPCYTSQSLNLYKWIC